MEKDQPKPFPPELLDILACPACEEHSPLQLQEAGLMCRHCKRVYPIRNGIPIMVTEDMAEL